MNCCRGTSPVSARGWISGTLPDLDYALTSRPFVGAADRALTTKRFRIVSDRFRNPLRTHHTKTSIVAGLVNIEAGFLPG